MDSGAALRDEASDRRVGSVGLEQFDQRLAGDEADDAGAVRVGE
jgi:hypothetical protein